MVVAACGFEEEKDMLNRLLLGVAFMVLLTGCGGGAASVNPGRMPEGGSFSGVFHSPQYGEMHLVQTGNTVVGEYKKDEREGKINGSVEGNLLRFEWVEKRALVSNRPTVTRGRGYFKYGINKANDEHEIRGEWGMGDEEQGGGPWIAYKSKHSKPQLSTDSTGSSSVGDDYGDETDKEEDYEEEAPEPEPEAEEDLDDIL